MSSKLTKNLFFFLLFLKFTTSNEDDFIFNGFQSSNLKLDGNASIASNGLLELTNPTKNTKGHAFYPIPLHFKNQSGRIFSFSTTFVFAILSQRPLSGHGIAFVISPTSDLSPALPGSYLGLFNTSNNGNSSSHIFAVELDTILNHEFQDIDDNHVGVDINSLSSNESHTAGYYDDSTGLFKNLTLMSGQPMQVWIDFDGEDNELNVSLSPVQMPKPSRPLLSSTIDLASLMLDSMYAGFSSSTGSVQVSHLILGWTFKMNGIAAPLDYTKIPSLPRIKSKDNVNFVAVWLPISSFFLVLLVAAAAAVLIAKRRAMYAELLEDWELQYGPNRFSYKDLFRATKGFEDKELLGIGGFGRVYRGVLPLSNTEIAVKKVAYEPRKGMREFVAEIVRIGQIRHQNLVQLLGYCRRKGELLLVSDFMPNGSLDRLLYDRSKSTLSWAQRFKIIKGVASGLSYLHDDWEPQVVIHRDIKANNVLLDSELNGRLGDFCFARLFDNGIGDRTAHVVGTMGYLAPELARTGKATTQTDVFAFGVLLLEITCGRRPVQHHVEGVEAVLMDWVLERWRRGPLINTLDPRLGEACNAYEVELVLKLGLLCSHPMPVIRPSMRQVMRILNGSVELPAVSRSYQSFSTMQYRRV